MPKQQQQAIEQTPRHWSTLRYYSFPLLIRRLCHLTMYVCRSVVVWQHFRAVMCARKRRNNRHQSPFRHLRKYLTTLNARLCACAVAQRQAIDGRGVGEQSHVTERPACSSWLAAS